MRILRIRIRNPVFVEALMQVSWLWLYLALQLNFNMTLLVVYNYRYCEFHQEEHWAIRRVKRSYVRVSNVRRTLGILHLTLQSRVRLARVIPGQIIKYVPYRFAGVSILGSSGYGSRSTVLIFNFLLKGSGQWEMRERGGAKMAIAYFLARIVVIDVLLSRYLATILKSCVFPLNYKKNIDHHYAKIIPSVSHLPQPAPFSLVPTFNNKCVSFEGRKEWKKKRNVKVKKLIPVFDLWFDWSALNWNQWDPNYWSFLIRYGMVLRFVIRLVLVRYSHKSVQYSCFSYCSVRGHGS